MCEAVEEPQRLVMGILLANEKKACSALLKALEELEPVAGGTTDGSKWCDGYEGTWAGLTKLANKTLFNVSDPAALVASLESLQQAATGMYGLVTNS